MKNVKKNDSKILNTEGEQLMNLIGNYKLGFSFFKFRKNNRQGNFWKS